MNLVILLAAQAISSVVFVLYFIKILKSLYMLHVRMLRLEQSITWRMSVLERIQTKNGGNR